MVISPQQIEPTGSGRQPLALSTTGEFIAELHERLAVAERRIALQLMTFDGDESGWGVARALAAAAGRGVEVRLLVDSFALRFVSDQPVNRPAVRAEFDATLEMFDFLAEAGVEIRFTNANGPGRIFSLARNHKKLYVIDEVVFLGGINVSDHNFEWHDFMVRLTEPAIRATVLADFDATFEGRYTSIEQDCGDDVTIVTNARLEPTFDRLLAQAKDRIIVASPYALDRRLARLLEASPAPSRTVVVADHNNFRFLQAITPYLVNRVARDGVELASYRRFSHSKFLLIDDDHLLVGSSNFGRHSLTCNQEIGLLIRDRDFIERFEATFLGDLQPVTASATMVQRLFGWMATAGMEGYLMAYARLVAPRVPLLAPGPGRRR